MTLYLANAGAMLFHSLPKNLREFIFITYREIKRGERHLFCEQPLRFS